jgi:hypothetical protein
LKARDVTPEVGTITVVDPLPDAPGTDVKMASAVSVMTKLLPEMDAEMSLLMPAPAV